MEQNCGIAASGIARKPLMIISMKNDRNCRTPRKWFHSDNPIHAMDQRNINRLDLRTGKDDMISWAGIPDPRLMQVRHWQAAPAFHKVRRDKRRLTLPEMPFLHHPFCSFQN
jgi:hypothetical protein